MSFATNFKLASGAPVALVCFANAMAQNAAPTPELPTVVISASGLPLTETAVNQSVSVFNRAQIEAEAAPSIAEFLIRRAGVVIDRSPRTGGYASLFLRGADPSHVVVLIDGIVQNDSLTSRGSAVDLNTLTIDDVERIEVVRGNASVVYGGALAGVVQIFTRPPTEKASARGSVEVGGDGLRAAAAGFSQNGFRASVSQREDGRESIAGENRTRSVNLGYRKRFGDTGVLAQARFADSRSSSFPDDSGGPRFAVIRTLERQKSDSRQLALALDQQIGQRQVVELQLSDFVRNSFSDTPGVAPGLRDPMGLPPLTSDGQYQRSDAKLRWRWSDAGWDLLLGAEALNESGRLDSTIAFGPMMVPANFELHRQTRSLVAEARKRWGALSVQVGLRHDRTPGQESLNHPALSMQYQLPAQTGRIGAAWSSASKLPSFFALGHPLVGNPDLKPEKSRQQEIYYATPDNASWRGRVTLFRAEYKELVDFDAGPPPRVVNRSSVTTKGVEFNVAHDWNRALRSYLQGTLMTLSVPDGGDPLRSRPKQLAGTGVDWDLAKHWRLTSGLTYIGRRYDSTIPTGSRLLGGYTTADLALTWRSGGAWQAFVAVDNLLDRYVEPTIGTPLGERRVRVGLRLNL
ncbi:MAG: TonB-dependent receptor [Burkholderiales bacterium]